MFNKGYRDRSISRFEDAKDDYNDLYEKMINNANQLYLKRSKFKEIIDSSWEFLNTLRNTPTELDTQIKKIEIERSRFSQLEKIMYEEANNVDIKATGSAAAGIATGAGVAAFGPSAAMGVAMTFGTASTGTAISSLSGAAATKAALAWLGGGALKIGGGGMAAGSAFLGLAGPLGWTIGGIALLGAGIFSNSKNKEIAAEANKKTAEIEAASKSSQGLIQEMKLIETEIKGVSDSLPLLLSICKNSNLDFHQMDTMEKNNIATLINNTQSAAKLLNKGIGDNAD